MADTTIFDYSKTRRNGASQAVAAAQQQLSDAQKAVSGAADQLAAKTALLVSLDKSAADIRRKLSVIPTPADGETLLAALEQITIRQRAAQSAIVDIEADVVVAQDDATQAQTDLATATAQLTTAEAGLQKATEGKARRDAWKTALAAEPLKSLDAAATKALDDTLPEGNTFKRARTRIEGDVPAKLRDRAEQRRAAETARLNSTASNTKTAAHAVVNERLAHAGLSGQAKDSWEAFLLIESATGDFVTGGVNRFDQAQKNMAGVSDVTNSPLTTEEKDRIHTTDAALETKREKAADDEKAVEDLRSDLEGKEALRDDAVVAAKAEPLDATKAQHVKDTQKDVNKAKTDFDNANDTWTAEQRAYTAAITDVAAKETALNDAIQKAIAAKADPNTDPAVGTAKTNLDNAKKTLKTDEDAYKASSKGILDAWEAAVPDATWRLFDDYEEAKEMLTALSAKKATQWQTELDTAEAAYVLAQATADASADIVSQLVAERQTRAAKEAGARQAATGRLFSALRGDN